MQTLADQLDSALSLNRVAIPDLWQTEAIRALREGNDVVVQAPTGAGKTLIFELWSHQGKNRAQAIYTVPTRALANDKLAEWRGRGWQVGIATGDLAEHLDAPIVVATLETQKHRLIQGDGPVLLVVDEYQMLADEDRGLNYELAMAMAPPTTQLLLLSGSVANPQHIVRWLERLGRRAVLIQHPDRPVPLEEVSSLQFNHHLPADLRGYWPRFVAGALADNLGPILIFAPQRHAAEKLAAELTRELPVPNPLPLREDQKQLVGDRLAKMLHARIAYHHSGLSYGARAGVIEPLAKAGQLRVVVATMGLAAGINFSLRSVALAGDSYRRELIEHPLRPDEILQMFGRAGRRGIDETGYVLVSANQIRLRDSYPAHLSRSGLVDWSALLGIMAAAQAQGLEPFTQAVKVQERLFTSKPITLGVEQSLKQPEVPCGLKTDPERARHGRKRFTQMRNSRGEWERLGPLVERPLQDIRILNISGAEIEEVSAGQELPWRSVLTEADVVKRTGHGTLCVLGHEEGRPLFGRLVTVAERLEGHRYVLAKWVRRLIDWKGRPVQSQVWHSTVVPMIQAQLARQKTPAMRFEESDHKVLACLNLAELTLPVPVDCHGVGLWKPPTRQVGPTECTQCSWITSCRQLPTASGVAMLWRRLGLIDAMGVPTRRGRVVSFFSQGTGLALAAGLEEADYPVEELVYELANLDAGYRFCREENRWAGRLAAACHACYGLQTIPGYLENGVPGKYGAGAEQIVASVHQNPQNRSRWINEFLGAGDIDRVIIEWRSLLRQVTHAPDLDWPRWMALKALSKSILNETQSPTLTELPPLDYAQTKRVDHRLIFRRR